jgi:hypothetical protein
MTNDAPPAKKESAAASARRRAAETRRQKILEQSRERMSTVEGLPPLAKDDEVHSETALIVEADAVEESAPVEKDIENAEKTETSGDSDENEVEKENVGIIKTSDSDTKTSEGEDGTWKPPSASRLQQMRRRRFKKQEPKKHEDEQQLVDNVNVNESSTAADEDKTNATSVQPQDRPVESDKPKQYMGVAKMRRQRILQQRAKDAEEESTANDGQDGDAPPLTMDELREKKMTLFQRHMPIVLELVVVTLLILCGADVGYQAFVQNTGVGVSDILEFQQASSSMAAYISDDRKLLYENGGVFKLGIHAGSNVPFLTSASDFMEETSVFGQGRKLFQDNLSDKDKKEDIVEPHVQYNDDGSVTPVDEFVDDAKGKGDAEVDDDEEDISFENPYEKKEEQKSEGDPLAALDAIFSFFFAIFGRFFGLFTGIFNFTCPPVFFVAAGVVRQAGRMTGCKSPAEVEKKRQEELDASLSAITGGDDKKMGSLPSIDIMGMVKKFFSTNFKTLTTLHSILSDARSDVYVVLCGWFLGLVIPKLYLWFVVMNVDDGGEKDRNCSFWTGSTNSFSSEL